MFFQSLNGLLPRHTCLSHDQFNVLCLNARIIHLHPIIFLLFLLRIGSFNSFTLLCVVVACMGIRSWLV